MTPKSLSKKKTNKAEKKEYCMRCGTRQIAKSNKLYCARCLKQLRLEFWDEHISNVLYDQRQEILDQVEKEVIREDRHSSKYCDEKSCVCTEKYKNELRAEQRIKLSALRKEEEK